MKQKMKKCTQAQHTSTWSPGRYWDVAQAAIQLLRHENQEGLWLSILCCFLLPQLRQESVIHQNQFMWRILITFPYPLLHPESKNMDPEPKSITDTCFNKEQTKMLIKVRKTLDLGLQGSRGKLINSTRVQSLTCQEEVPGRAPGEGGTGLHKESDDNLSHEWLFSRPPTTPSHSTRHASSPATNTWSSFTYSVYFKKKTCNTLHTAIHSSDKQCSTPLPLRELALAYWPT